MSDFDDVFDRIEAVARSINDRQVRDVFLAQTNALLELRLVESQLQLIHDDIAHSNAELERIIAALERDNADLVRHMTDLEEQQQELLEATDSLLSLLPSRSPTPGRDRPKFSLENVATPIPKPSQSAAAAKPNCVKKRSASSRQRSF